MRYLPIAIIAALSTGCAVGPAQYGGPSGGAASSNTQAEVPAGSDWCDGAQAALDKSGRCADRDSASSSSASSGSKDPATGPTPQRQASADRPSSPEPASSSTEPAGSSTPPMSEDGRTGGVTEPEPESMSRQSSAREADMASSSSPANRGSEPGTSAHGASQPSPQPAVPPQRGVTAAESPDTRILRHPAGHYAVQLAAGDSQEAMQRFARVHGLDGTLTARIESDGRTWHVLLLGIYPSHSEARAALAQVNEKLDTRPWIRTVGSLQQGIERAL